MSKYDLESLPFSWEEPKGQYASKAAFIDLFRKRTKRFAVDTILLCNGLQRGTVNFVLVNQLVKSATSVGANYRAACRSRSKAEFFSKISLVVEEADESQYWLEVFQEATIVTGEEIQRLHREVSEILAVVTTARDNTN